MLLYETRGTAKFYYSYDANGVLYSVSYTSNDSAVPEVYYYTHNMFGDIVGIYDSLGSLVAQYEYDSWGNIVSIKNAGGGAITKANHIANLNPFRYRGYYYDTESGLYYLMSRYYDPVTHRFINSDGTFQSSDGILSANAFAYSGNCPIMCSDPSGEHSCGDPTCIRCNSSRRSFVMNNYAWIKRVNPDFSPFPSIFGISSTITTMSFTNELVTSRATNYVRCAPKPKNIGVGTYRKSVETQIQSIEKFHHATSTVLDTAGYALDAASIAIDVGVGVYNNIEANSSWDKIAYDVSADFVCSALPVVLSLVGGCIGGPLGVAVGFGVGALITMAVDYIPCGGYDSFRNYIKSGYKG